MNKNCLRAHNWPKPTSPGEFWEKIRFLPKTILLAIFRPFFLKIAVFFKIYQKHKKSIKSNKNGPRWLKMVINHHWDMFHKVTSFWGILGHIFYFLAKNQQFLANLAILGSFLDRFSPRKWPILKKTKIPPTEFQRIIFTRFL